MVAAEQLVAIIGSLFSLAKQYLQQCTLSEETWKAYHIASVRSCKDRKKELHYFQ